jgi:hypothetical protein
MDLSDPIATAIACTDALGRAGIRHALYGGLLTAAYGEARETRDVDLAVGTSVVDEALQALNAAALAGAVAFREVRFGGLVLGRIALMRRAGEAQLNTLDLVRPRSARLALQILDRAPSAPLRDAEVRVVTPEDYVILKILSTRDLDLQDAAAVLRRGVVTVDLDLIGQEIERSAVECPDLPVHERFERVRALAREP